MCYVTSKEIAVATRVYRCEGQPGSNIGYAYPPMLRGSVSISTHAWCFVCVNPDLDITCSPSYEPMVESGEPDHPDCNLDGPQWRFKQNYSAGYFMRPSATSFSYCAGAGAPRHHDLLVAA